jgi:2'-5' RNA ligase
MEKNESKWLMTFEQFMEVYGNPINEEKNKYGCAMLFFNFPEIKVFQEKIEKDDLTGDGFEDEPHVTLLNGLHSDEIEDDDVISKCGKGISSILLHNFSCFKNDDYDILKLDVRSNFLHDINGELSKLPHTTDFPDYHPHCTIAYVKKGKGKKYVEMFLDRSFEVFPTKIVYSKPDGSRIQSGFKLKAN